MHFVQNAFVLLIVFRNMKECVLVSAIDRTMREECVNLSRRLRDILALSPPNLHSPRRPIVRGCSRFPLIHRDLRAGQSDRSVSKRYHPPTLGRQELDGEMIEDREDALWSRAAIESLKLRETGPLGRIVVAVDPPSGAGRGSCCGIIVAGLDRAGRGVVLADCSVEGASPAGWAAAVVRAYRRFDADRIVAEVNQGGDMVQAVLRGIDAQLPVTSVRASRGKWLRAEPVAALYEQGRVVHAGSFPALEDQMCEFRRLP